MITRTMGTHIVTLLRQGELRSVSIGLLVMLGLSGAVDSRAETDKPRGTVRGQVVIDEFDSYRGVVALWPADDHRPPDPRRYVLIPCANRSLQTDGRFEIEAPPGRYYLGVIVRTTPGSWQGPPRLGDRVFLSPDSSGRSQMVEISAGQRLETGRHTDSWAFAGKTHVAGDPEITGTLRDQAGQPVAGMLVFAFTDPELTNEPVAVSAPSGPNGGYSLNVDRAATVYLRARAHYGPRRPQSGGRMGVYGGALAQAVRVERSAAVAGIDIEILDIPPLEERQKTPSGGGAKH